MAKLRQFSVVTADERKALKSNYAEKKSNMRHLHAYYTATEDFISVVKIGT